MLASWKPWRAAVAAIATALGVFSTSPSQAAVLHHAYRFDPARLRLAPSPAGLQVHATGLPSTWEEGFPELPYDVVTLLVPRGTRLLGVRARGSDEVVLAAEAQLCLAAPVRDEAGKPLAPKPPRLAGGALYPALEAEPAGSGALHGYQVVAVRVYPVRYDAERRLLLASRRLDLELELAPDGAPPLARARFSAGIEAQARTTLARLVANPAALEGYERPLGRWVDSRRGFRPSEAPSLEGSAVEYVIVTSQAQASVWQEFATWKTARGVPTVVRTLEWIDSHYRHGCDVQETIRTFIRDAYTQWGVQWVLLAGDTDVIPARFGFSAFGDVTQRDIPTDAYFACLDGNWNRDGDGVFGEAATSASDPGDSTDLYAEVYVGRAPVSTAAEASALVNKIVTYESPPNTAYQRRLLMLGEVLFPVDWQPGDPISYDGAAFSAEMLAFAGPCADILRLYQNFTQYPGSEPLTKQRALAEMSAGPGFVNHIGHGYSYSMSLGDGSMTNADALALGNGDQRFVLYMLNCTATAFDFPCLAEAFLDAPGGAVAVLGASRSAYAIPSRNYNREFFRALHQNGAKHLGEAFVQSRLPYTPNAYFDTSDHYSHLLYNFLGDPEMVVHTCSLTTTAVVCADSLGLGGAGLAVHVTAGGAPQAGALVCASKGLGGAEAYAHGSTDSNGDVTLDFRPESAGTAQLTVSGQNMRMLTRTLSVVPQPGPYLHADTLALDDDASGASAGNGDGVLDAGETFEVDVTFRNDGPAAASGVTGVLRSPSPHVTVVDSTVTVGDIEAGSTATVLHEAAFSVAASAPDGAVLPLVFVLTDSVQTWTDTVKRVSHAPSMRLTLLDVDDPAPGGNADGLIQAGETFDLLAFFKNDGTGAADGLLATLVSGDPDVTLVEDSVLVGRAAPQQELTGTTRFRLSEAVLEENSLTLALTDDQGRSRSWSITLRGPAKPATPVLSAKSGNGVVTATWIPSSETDLAGYHVYRALALAGPWTRITTDATVRTAYYRDTGLAASTRYYYRVTAVDGAGNESVPSTVANINTSPPQLAGWPIRLGAQSSCPVAVGDLTGDGSKEIVAGNDHLYAWNWNGIELRDGDNDPLTWGVFVHAVKTVTGAVAVAEMDGLPGDEVLVSVWDDSNKVFCVRGDGTALPGWPRNPDPTSAVKGYWAASAAVDVDADGRAELFLPAKNGNLYAWHADSTPLGATAAFKSGFSTYMRTSPSFANLDADPELEIVFGAPNGQLHIWNVDGSSLPGFPVTGGTPGTPATLCLSSTAVGDVNGDGTLDVVMITEGGYVNVFDTATATQLGGWPRGLSVKSNPISPSPALADFDGDGKLEIIIANNALPLLQSAVRVYDWQGNLLAGWPRYTGGVASESSPIVADITGDGAPDILFGNEGGFIYGWDWNGNELAGFPLTIGAFVRSTPFVDDVDGDGHANLVLAGWDQNVYIWDFPAPWIPQAAPWPTLKHDRHRSGTAGFVFDIAPPSPPTALASSSHTPGTWSGDSTVDVAWSGASDPSGIGGYSFTWDGNPATLPDDTLDTSGSSTTSPPLAAGAQHWFHLRTADLLGNWTPGALHLGPFQIDTTPPVNSASASADRPLRTWSNDNTIGAAWPAATDSLSGIGGYSLGWDTDSIAVPDASTETAALEAESPALADGQTHWFHLRAVDAAGNAAEAASTVHRGPFWIDATPPQDPTGFTVVPAVNVWGRADTIQVGWSGQTDGLSGVAGFSVAFDGNATTVPDSSLDTTGASARLTPAPEGSTWFHLRTGDVAGNWTSTAHVGPFRIDRTPPAVTIVAPNGGEVWAHQSVQTIRWRATDAASGVHAVELRYSTDGGSTYPYLITSPPGADSTYAWTVPLAIGGAVRVQAIATDAAGNPGTDASDASFAITTAVDAASLPPVDRTWLAPPAPNPFNPSTTLRYSLLEPGQVRLVIYDAQGRRVRTLVDAWQEGPRWYSPRWDGRDDRGGRAAGGTYFAALRAGGHEWTHRLVLVK